MTISLQGRDAERLVAVHRKRPVHSQLFPVQSHSGLSQLVLLGWDRTIKQQAVFNGINGFVTLITDMDVWRVVTTVIPEKHQHQNSVKHADG
jgi:hypothetical protein